MLRITAATDLPSKQGKEYKVEVWGDEVTPLKVAEMQVEVLNDGTITCVNVSKFGVCGTVSQLERQAKTAVRMLLTQPQCYKRSQYDYCYKWQDLLQALGGDYFLALYVHALFQGQINWTLNAYKATYQRDGAQLYEARDKAFKALWPEVEYDR